ncbi:predicted protein [Plenodomus lingam JN3]|uniref:Predicted protein n=1 Tax=Leptosphaeria maculans (strain JN3 / isolate v23.1.3 / race Av1-4-5-6-7-8) TaxID=985895 RepID=E4ZPS1_LEPMJ|nr:predicted protein [Plenodomus lingam JN3]CBX93456.1 predicted protein [Plenodomus lingam JN3]
MANYLSIVYPQAVALYAVTTLYDSRNLADMSSTSIELPTSHNNITHCLRVQTTVAISSSTRTPCNRL